MINGYEYLSHKEKLRELGENPEKRMLRRILPTHSRREQGVKKPDPGSSWWYPVTEGEAMDTNQSMGNFIWTQYKPLLLWGWSDTGTGCSERLCSPRLWVWFCDPAHKIISSVFKLARKTGREKDQSEGYSRIICPESRFCLLINN